MGGFFIAFSMEKWGLHRRLALAIVTRGGTSPAAMLFAFMAATAILSLIVSNTATTLIMMPIAVAVLHAARIEAGHTDGFAGALAHGLAQVTTDCIAIFDADFVPEAVQSVVSQLLAATEIGEHRRIARNMLAFMGRLQPGSKAPDFSARTRENTVGSLGMFRGRWIYLNFFSSANSSSLREMAKIAGTESTLVRVARLM